MDQNSAEISAIAERVELLSTKLRRELARIDADIAAKTAKGAELLADIKNAEAETSEAASVQVKALMSDIDAKAVAAAVKTEEAAQRRVRNARSAIGMLESELIPLRVRKLGLQKELELALEEETNRAVATAFADVRTILVASFARLHVALENLSWQQRNPITEEIGGIFVDKAIVPGGLPTARQWSASRVDAALGAIISRFSCDRSAPIGAPAVELGPDVGVGVLARVAYATANKRHQLEVGTVANLPTVVARRLVELGLAILLKPRVGYHTFVVSRSAPIEIEGASITYPAGLHSVTTDRAHLLLAAGGTPSDALAEADLEFHRGANSAWSRALPEQNSKTFGSRRSAASRTAALIDLGNVAHWPLVDAA